MKSRKLIIDTENLQQKEEVTKLNQELLTYRFLLNHNLQEPLRNIQVMSSLILEEEKKNLSEQGKEYLKRLSSSASLMRNLVQDLLEYSDIKDSMKLERTDLNEILKEVVHEFGDEIVLKKAKVVGSELCSIKVIRFQFRTLLKDLLSNSLKFSLAGVPPKIVVKSEIIAGRNHPELNLSRSKQYCHISFSDNGIGFEQQFDSLIFEIFQKLNANKYKGTGMGLAICKKIVENHGGIITATSTPRKGSTFDIYIPTRATASTKKSSAIRKNEEKNTTHLKR